MNIRFYRDVRCRGAEEETRFLCLREVEAELSSDTSEVQLCPLEGMIAYEVHIV